MIGILLVTHNSLGDSLVDGVRHVMGRVPPQLKVLSVTADDAPEKKEQEACALIADLDTGDGVLLLVDVFGATPSNIVRRLCQPGKVVGIAGVNLPMLLRVVCYRDRSLSEIAQKALQGGRECIVLMDRDGEFDDPARCADN